jgi:(4-(4-[2-(gamma-L-glutamylamino)ethyl]phenoxymethyl)furan-2-yl)methanamine synthase
VTDEKRNDVDVAGTSPADVIGWDIGGVNTKVARVVDGEVLAVRGRPFELQRAPHVLTAVLRELAAEAGMSANARAAHAVTMTAELSQMFRTKREGVAFVLDAVQEAFSASVIRAFAVDGRFLDLDQARREPLAVAAANWAATALVVARHHPDSLLVDVGTTTTDIIPIVCGVVAAEGRTDPERLASGELVYTGAVRTPVEAIVSQVPLGAGLAGVSAEGFALAGDVHMWSGDLAPADYTVPTPDGRPATRQFAGERLARVVCADRPMLGDAGVSALADAVAAAQVGRIASAVRRVVARRPTLRTAVVTGLGAFLGEAAARAAGLDVVPLAAGLGPAAARCAPAVSVGLLLDMALKSGVRTDARDTTPEARHPFSVVEVVVKLGGGVLQQIDHFDAAVAAIEAAARGRRLLVVPGGGPFADAVRDVDRRIGLTDDAAHWMAVLAMDQYAELVAARMPRGVVATDRSEIAAACDAGRVPVLAPSRWLRTADPVPHTWEATSDSIAAWVAGTVGARRLILVKPAGVPMTSSQPTAGLEHVDSCFSSLLPTDVTATIVPADELDRLRALCGT